MAESAKCLMPEMYVFRKILMLDVSVTNRLKQTEQFRKMFRSGKGS